MGSKFLEIKKEILILNRKRDELNGKDEESIEVLNARIKELYDLAANMYYNYFFSKDNDEFVYYHEFPKKEEVWMYDNVFTGEHPLSDFGYFEVRELAMVIKFLYSFLRQKEYEVITFGYLSDIPFYEPKICFLIGDDKGIEGYKGFFGCFLDSPQLFCDDLNKSKFNRIALMVDDSINATHELKIFPDSDINNCFDRGFGYYHPITGKYYRHRFCDFKNIFSDYINWNHYQGIKDTLSFPIHFFDSEIANILISIAIYKKNNRKIWLSNDDYFYIFNKLYGEDVDINLGIEREIPKVLKYSFYKNKKK